MQVITRKQLLKWLDDLSATRTLIAPQETEGGVLYRPVSGSDEIVYDFSRPILSIKDTLFPPTEQLLVIKKSGQQIRIKETIPQGERVVFGVRPCDARGVKTLDAMFLDKEPQDTYYARRRAQTTLVGLACTSMGDTCFCTSMGVNPNDTDGMDIMLFEVDGGYAIEIITEKGAKAAEGLSLREVDGMPPEPALRDTVPVLPKDAWPSQFDSPIWAEMGERCLSCRACAYVCPTCRCFDVRDETVSSQSGNLVYERIRGWDSCTSVSYRKEAGGHNSREAKGDRLRNRFFCKFYYYPEQYGPAACTGCGRCIDACPVNIDITEVLGALISAQQEAIS